MTTTKQSSSRRRFLRAAGTSAAGVLLAGMPKGFTGGVYAADGPETTAMRFGIIALTDNSPSDSPSIRFDIKFGDRRLASTQ